MSFYATSTTVSSEGKDAFLATSKTKAAAVAACRDNLYGKDISLGTLEATTTTVANASSYVYPCKDNAKKKKAVMFAPIIATFHVVESLLTLLDHSSNCSLVTQEQKKFRANKQRTNRSHCRDTSDAIEKEYHHNDDDDNDFKRLLWYSKADYRSFKREITACVRREVTPYNEGIFESQGIEQLLVTTGTTLGGKSNENGSFSSSVMDDHYRLLLTTKCVLLASRMGLGEESVAAIYQGSAHMFQLQAIFLGWLSYIEIYHSDAFNVLKYGLQEASSSSSTSNVNERSDSTVSFADNNVSNLHTRTTTDFQCHKDDSHLSSSQTTRTLNDTTTTTTIVSTAPTTSESMKKRKRPHPISDDEDDLEYKKTNNIMRKKQYIVEGDNQELVLS